MLCDNSRCRTVRACSCHVIWHVIVVNITRSINQSEDRKDKWYVIIWLLSTGWHNYIYMYIIYITLWPVSHWGTRCTRLWQPSHCKVKVADVFSCIWYDVFVLHLRNIHASTHKKLIMCPLYDRCYKSLTFQKT